MKSMLMFLSLFQVLSQDKNYSGTQSLTDEQSDEKEKENLLKYYKRKGLKEYYINGVTIFARNEKNAKRKYNNIKKHILTL